MNWAVLVAAASLSLFPPIETPAVRDAAPNMLLWNINGLENPTGPITVLVKPTQLGLVLGLDVKAIHVRPVATREDQKPTLMLPLTAKRTDWFALYAVFRPVGRRFFLIVTLQDGTTTTIDPWGPAPSEQWRWVIDVWNPVRRG